MSRRDMKRGKKSRRFIMLEHSMFQSAAFNALSSSAIRVLLSIMSCKTGDNGTAAKPIRCDYSTMNGNMAKATIATAINDIEAKGFLKIVRGGLYKQPNLYVLSPDWINWKKPEKGRSKI